MRSVPQEVVYQNYERIYLRLHACYMLCPSHAPSLDHLNNICKEYKIRSSSLISFNSCYTFPLTYVHPLSFWINTSRNQKVGPSNLLLICDNSFEINASRYYFISGDQGLNTEPTSISSCHKLYAKYK
jgi:hypothetical protein